MRLTELDAKFWKYIGDNSFETVGSLAEATSIIFLCPKCFEKNAGPVGTHSIRVDFIGRDIPDEVCMHNDQGQPVRWHASGSGLEDLTLNPSILLLKCCGWHGFVREGGIVDA
jgi:hypothetical protein